jgi:hypothetical protein
LDGEILTFAPSGWTWHDIFILWDYETGSLWFPGLQFPGGSDYMQCIAGPLQDKRVLAVQGYERLTWRGWVTAHPETGSMIVKKNGL